MNSMWKKTVIAWLFLTAMTGAALAQNEQVLFSSPGGFYPESFELSLECFYPNHHIRYTTNGSTPSSTSPLYTGPLALDENLYSHSNIYTVVNCIPSLFHEVDDVQHAIVIRAAVFDENGNCVSTVNTNSYFIRSLGCDFGGLPVLAIAVDSLSLFDYETGIFIPGIYYDSSDSTHTGNFHMTGKEWERRINLEFYETDNSGINQTCGLRTHGGASRWFQQKGMRVYAREEYGKKRFEHRFFQTTPINSFKRLCLHPFRCSNWLQTGGQDHLSQMVAAQLDIDGLAVRQTVVFINGEYWGIYTLEESPDQRYLEDHHDVNIDLVNIIKFWILTDYGDATDWLNFRDWISSADLSLPEDSTYAFSRIDIPSFIDYYLLETFSGNLDWPGNNVLLWQSKDGAPFRMIFFDGDGCFSRWYYKALDHSTHSGGNSVVINKLLSNHYFTQLLQKRYSELLASVFHYDTLKALWDDYRNLVEEEVPRQSERFGFPVTMARWQSDMDSTEAFFTKRIQSFNKELSTLLGLNEHHDPTLSPITVYPNPSAGTFMVSTAVGECSELPIDVYDLLGRRVHSEKRSLTAGENQLTLTLPLRPGMYLMHFGNVTKRILIQ